MLRSTDLIFSWLTQFLTWPSHCNKFSWRLPEIRVLHWYLVNKQDFLIWTEGQWTGHNLYLTLCTSAQVSYTAYKMSFNEVNYSVTSTSDARKPTKICAMPAFRPQQSFISKAESVPCLWHEEWNNRKWCMTRKWPR